MRASAWTDVVENAKQKALEVHRRLTGQGELTLSLSLSLSLTLTKARSRHSWSPQP